MSKFYRVGVQCDVCHEDYLAILELETVPATQDALKETLQFFTQQSMLQDGWVFEYTTDDDFALCPQCQTKNMNIS